MKEEKSSNPADKTLAPGIEKNRKSRKRREKTIDQDNIATSALQRDVRKEEAGSEEVQTSSVQVTDQKMTFSKKNLKTRRISVVAPEDLYTLMKAKQEEVGSRSLNDFILTVVENFCRS